MATSDQVTAWDENGKPISSPQSAQAWDENGKPIGQHSAQGSPITDTSTVGAAPSTLSRVADAAVNSDFPFIHPIKAAEAIAAPYENYTQQGREEHPVLSRVGDAAAGAQELGRIAGPEVSLLGLGGAGKVAEAPAIAKFLDAGSARNMWDQVPAIGSKAASTASRNLPKISVQKDWKIPGTPITLSRAPTALEKQEDLGSFMNRGYKPADQANLDVAVRSGQAGRLPVKVAMPGPELGSAENPGWMAKLPTRMPEPQAPPPDPVLQAIREGRAARVPTRMPALPSAAPEVGTPENPGWMAKIPDRMPTIAAPEPELGTEGNPGWLARLPNRMPVKQLRPEVPTMAAPGGEGPIGSGSIERQIQTLMQKPILTPEEQSFIERNLGPNANMRSGEGLTKWRNRVTGNLKAARARTE